MTFETRLNEALSPKRLVLLDYLNAIAIPFSSEQDLVKEYQRRSISDLFMKFGPRPDPNKPNQIPKTPYFRDTDWRPEIEQKYQEILGITSSKQIQAPFYVSPEGQIGVFHPLHSGTIQPLDEKLIDQNRYISYSTTRLRDGEETASDKWLEEHP